MGPVRIPQDPQRGLEDSPGPHEIPGDTSGPRGVPQDPAGFFCPPLDSQRFQRTPLDSSGGPPGSVGLHRFSKSSAKLSGFRRGSVVCQTLQRCFRTPQGFQGSPRSRRMPCESSLILAILRESPAGFGGSFEPPWGAPRFPLRILQFSFGAPRAPSESSGSPGIPREPPGALSSLHDS